MDWNRTIFLPTLYFAVPNNKYSELQKNTSDIFESTY